MPTFSFDVDTNTATRISVAVGNRMGLGRNASAAEVKQFIVAFLKEQVHNAEVSAEREKISVTDIEVV